jgi:hypothetical protein
MPNILDVDGLAIPVFRLVAIVAVLLVLARNRYDSSDSLPWGLVLVVAILLFASSAYYVGAPVDWAVAMVNVASAVIMGAALLRLVRT